MEGGKGRWEVRRDREKEGCGQKRRDSKGVNAPDKERNK